MTVAMYHSDGAEKVCLNTLLPGYISGLICAGMAGGYFAVLVAPVSEDRRCCSIFMDFPVSHPDFLQLCGITASSTMHAAIFHGGTLREVRDY
jgi:hypothetical protein